MKILLLFLFAMRASALEFVAMVTHGKTFAASTGLSGWSAHHLVGDRVRFALKTVAGFVDGEWFLIAGLRFLAEQAQHSLIAHGTLQAQQAWRPGRRRSRYACGEPRVFLRRLVSRFHNSLARGLLPSFVSRTLLGYGVVWIDEDAASAAVCSARLLAGGALESRE